MVLFFSAYSCKTENEDNLIRSGEIWYDTDGNPINAHAGGFLFHKGKYYWYGEVKTGETTYTPDQLWEAYRVEAGGISVYSSENLVDWTYEGLALPPNATDPEHDLHPSKTIERPKVIYNDSTGKFVMWLHVDNEFYSYARAGVAVSDTPEGPFTYLGSIRPNGFESRDMTVYKDDDGRAYLIFSSDNNYTMRVSLLTDDYLNTTDVHTRIFVDMSREAPAVFKHNDKYYMITSGCTGWEPNAAMIASADSILGEWTPMYNPCVGPDSDITFDSQSTFVLPIESKPGHFIFMADRWVMRDLEDSRYVWLPIIFRNDSIVIEWKDAWRLDI